MRLFYICQRVPFPPDRGDKITTFNEVRHLARANELYVFCLAEDTADLDNIAGLKDIVARIIAVPVARSLSRVRAAAALFRDAPLSVAAYNEPKLHAELAVQHSALKPDAVVVFSSNMAQYALPLGGTPRILKFQELDSLKWHQYAERTHFPMNWLYALEERRLRRYERMIARSFSHSLVVTEGELRDFARLIPGVPVSVVGNGVDLDFFGPGGGPKVPGSMIFTGVMDYLPNIDAVEWFTDKVLPLVQDVVPGATFVICGTRPAPRVTRLAQRRGITVTGRVPDTRTYLDAAELAVAPLRIARGIQNKVLEALATGLPVVSSIAAWQGTGLSLGDGILASDEPEEIAATIVRLLRDDDYRREMGRKARAAVVANYSWATQLARLDQVIERCAKSARTSESRGATQ